jgi:Universal stress protein family
MEKNVDGVALATVKKILAPIDRSGYEVQILAFAISIGKAWGAEITAIYVIDPGRGVPGGRVKEKGRGERRRSEERGGKFTSSVC